MAAGALHDHRFGWLGHSLVGLIGGALSGYFLQATVLTVVNGGGGMNQPTVAEAAVIEGLTGAVVGAIAMAVIGFLINASSNKA
jgi:Na+/proline symporter